MIILLKILPGSVRILLPAVGWSRRVAFAASFAAGIALVLLPVAVRNASVSGDFHLTTSQFGHNFYIGNNEAADGTYKPLLFARGDPRVEIQDAIDGMAFSVIAEYDAEAGYPISVSIDHIEHAIDDEMGLTVASFQLGEP